jgi:hypothetical protein
MHELEVGVVVRLLEPSHWIHVVHDFLNDHAVKMQKKSLHNVFPIQNL